jgi:DNA-binding GntR family transcriptional regulator
MDTRTLKDQVVQLLSDAILSGKIKPGDRLNESKLARELGISRIPIREGLQQLEERGLVVDIPRRGKFVVSLAEEDIQKINSLRLVLETEALLLCRAKISEEGVQSLTALLDKMIRSEELPEIEAAALDLEFHRTVWGYSGNEYLVNTLESLMVPFFAHRALWRINREMLGWAAILTRQHRALLDFVLGLSEKTAQEVMLGHLSYRFNQPARFSSLALGSPEVTQTPMPGQ